MILLLVGFLLAWRLFRKILSHRNSSAFPWKTCIVLGSGMNDHLKNLVSKVATLMKFYASRKSFQIDITQRSFCSVQTIALAMNWLKRSLIIQIVKKLLSLDLAGLGNRTLPLCLPQFGLYFFAFHF